MVITYSIVNVACIDSLTNTLNIFCEQKVELFKLQSTNGRTVHYAGAVTSLEQEYYVFSAVQSVTCTVPLKLRKLGKKKKLFSRSGNIKLPKEEQSPSAS